MARTVDEARHRERRALVVETAAELFAKRGFAKTTTASIARAAGISTGSLFYYFTDKHAIFRAIFEQDIPDSEALFAGHADTTDPLASILDIVGTLAEPAREDLAHGLLVELLRVIDDDPKLARVVMANEAIVHTGFTQLIEKAAAAGSVDPELDAGEAATWIRSIIDAAYLNADPDAKTDPVPMLKLIVARFLGNDTSLGDRT
ncbi:TetR/AcrR family transcriptional regulator [Sciscionella sediminilitoris]|uniref:TetR/AcrR family transcriptional regulator n=1 Tax=Sciscionella sediminilitoris TaxID=1445613 RepID=UPI0004DEFDE7|nr:TetR/AcrR family transcriptional regulator [Sciscionella sp. SE31]